MGYSPRRVAIEYSFSNISNILRFLYSRLFSECLRMPTICTPFKCQKCGNCCRNLVGTRFGMALTIEEYNRLKVFAHRHSIKFEPAPLAKSALGVVNLYQFSDNVCPFLRDNKCSCYQIRPVVCRMFPMHPGGFFECPAMDHAIKTNTRLNGGTAVAVPKHMEDAAKEYMLTIQTAMESAMWVYDLNRGWRERRSIRPVHEEIDEVGDSRIV